MNDVLRIFQSFMEDDPVFGSIVQGLSDSQNEQALGKSLPTVLTDEDLSAQAWTQLLGSEKALHQYLKDIVVSGSSSAKMQKAALSLPLDRTIEMLSKYYSMPAFRRSIPENSTRKCVSEMMLSRLLQFDEYKNYSLEMSESDLNSVLYTERGSLFKGGFTFFSKLAVLPSVEDRVVKRMLRLNKLEPLLVDLDNLHVKKKNDLIIGIFGLFDMLDSPFVFVELVEAYPQLQSYFEDVYLIRDLVHAIDNGDYCHFKIKLMTQLVLNSQMLDYCEGVPLLLDNQEFQELANLQTQSILRSSAESYNKLAHTHKSHVLQGSELGEVEVEQFINSLKPKDLRLVVFDLTIVWRKLSTIAEHPFVQSILRKDEEKLVIAEALRNLDSSNISAAMELVEKVKVLCTSIVDAPAELQQQITEFSALYDRFQRKYKALCNAHDLPERATEDVSVAAEVPLLNQEGQEAIKALASLRDEVSRLQQQLQDSETNNADLVSKNEMLTEKFQDQKNELGRIKSLQHALHTNEVNKPIQYDGGFVKKIAEQISGGVKNPEDMLRAFAVLYPDRLEVLDSAYSSAKGSSEFKNLERLGNFILILVTDYLRDLLNGVPDAQARLLFGSKAFRAAESDSVLASDKLRGSREFVYNGQKRVFERNLAIGIKYGAVNSLRMYFDVIDSKVVIAYCGEHLGNTRTT
jgi:hypothetical protein